MPREAVDFRRKEIQIDIIVSTRTGAADLLDQVEPDTGDRRTEMIGRLQPCKKRSVRAEYESGIRPRTRTVP